MSAIYSKNTPKSVVHIFGDKKMAKTWHDGPAKKIIGGALSKHGTRTKTHQRICC